MSADVLAFGAHPDDAELSFGGTLTRLAQAGQRVVVIDLTAGERASRGDPETRAAEAEAAAAVLGVSERLCVGMPDQEINGSSIEQRRSVVEVIRRFRPSTVLAPHPLEGHPDHRGASQLIELACEESRFWRSTAGGERHVVDQLLFAWPAAGADQSAGAGGGGALGGGFVVDVTEVFATKLRALECHKTQFGAGPGPETRLADDFLELVSARARVAGAAIGVRFGEGFVWRGALKLQLDWSAWIGRNRMTAGSTE